MNWQGVGAILFIIGFSIFMIHLGVKGLLKRKSKVIGPGILAPRKYTYEGKHSIAPSIVYLFVGFAFPLAIVSEYINLWLNIDYAMPIIFGLAVISAVFSIFYFTYRKKGEDHTYKE